MDFKAQYNWTHYGPRRSRLCLVTPQPNNPFHRKCKIPHHFTKSVGYFYKKYHIYFNTHLCVSIIS